MENYETLRSFTEGIQHYETLFDIQPRVLAHDLHPEYLSTKYALERAGVDLIGVQHHHAHIASCLADNGRHGPVLGVAFDGLGYGPDETIWGGEFLLADLAGFQRLGHLAPVPMPGGPAAVKQPWRMAAAYLAEGDPDLEVYRRNASRWAAVLDLAGNGLNSPLTSSAGRLFDAVSAILGVRDTINYEGQAAVELEQLADPRHRAAYRATVTEGRPFVVSGADLVHASAADLRRGVDRGHIAARFHNGLVDAIVGGCTLAAERSGVHTVALSGGVFGNLLLLEGATRALSESGFEVLTHARVPTNDGGVSLGQVAVAGASDSLSSPRRIHCQGWLSDR